MLIGTLVYNATDGLAQFGRSAVDARGVRVCHDRHGSLVCKYISVVYGPKL
jgi:hypothetical protein